MKETTFLWRHKHEPWENGTDCTGRGETHLANAGMIKMKAATYCGPALYQSLSRHNLRPISFLIYKNYLNENMRYLVFISFFKYIHHIHMLSKFQIQHFPMVHQLPEFNWEVNGQGKNICIGLGAGASQHFGRLRQADLLRPDQHGKTPSLLKIQN